MTARGCLAVALAALCAGAQALPLLGGHHRSGGGTPPVSPDRLTVSAAISDPAAVGDDGALDLELIGDVVLGVAPDHAGYTACTGRCQIAPPLRSRVLVVAPKSRLVLAADWTAPAGATLNLAATSLAQVRVTLGGALTVSITGAPPTLPLLLVSATAITATISQGTVPAGTHLTITETNLYLEANP